MKCDFCGWNPVDHFHVPTRIGRVAQLCSECWGKHGTVRARRATGRGPPARAAPILAQLPLFGVQERGGAAGEWPPRDGSLNLP